MYAEAQLNPQFLANHHGNRQADMTASRIPPSCREDSHENLRSPFGSCNAHTQLPWQNQARCAERIRSKKICDAAAGKPSRDAKGRRRRAQRRSWGRNLSQNAKGPQGAVPLRASLGAYRKAPSASATPCPPAAWRCSTLGEGGLNCRVRDGTG